MLPAPNFPATFAGSPVIGRLARVRFELLQRRFDVEVVFVERLELPYALLGRRGIFAQFNRVAFIEKSSPAHIEFQW